jgi:ornithine cyclodeaminase
VTVEVIDRRTVTAHVSLTDAYDAVRRAFHGIAEGTALQPESIGMRLPNGGVVHVKGGYLCDSRWLSFKVASGDFPGAQNSGCSLVVDAASGTPVAVLADGGWLTEMRTAATGALATQLLARREASRLAILGTGQQARYQIAALRQIRPLSDVVVWGRREEAARALAGEVRARVASSAEAAVSGADIVVTTTSAERPVLLGQWLSPGTHVTAMGSDMEGKRELDVAVVERAAVIASDNVELAARVGELQHAPALAERAVSLSELTVRATTGRRSEADITVADLCGLGVVDAAMVDLVMQRQLGQSGSR